MSLNCLEQPQNLNFLEKNKFKFVIKNTPIINYFCTSVNVPNINLDVCEQSTRYNKIFTPGDEINYGDLNIEFQVDEDLTNYLELFNWITSLGHPKQLQDLYQYQIDSINDIRNRSIYNHGSVFSDATLTILNSSGNENYELNFIQIFPIRLGQLDFNTKIKDADYMTCDATFLFLYMDFKKL